MTIRAALLTSLLGICCWAQASSLTIAPGETFTVGSQQQFMQLQSLSIGDNARIEFADGISQWQLRADNTEIGFNVVIDGSGSEGVEGLAGDDAGGKAKSCRNGQRGKTGGDGSNGANGVTMRLQLGLVSLGSLQVIGDGGAGGAGGRGGAGQDAGKFKSNCKEAPNGGAAGAGGSGGNGGAAGSITVSYWPVSSVIIPAKVPQLITASAKAGAAGTAGPAGKAGKGSEGRYINKRTLTGSRAWVGGGKDGSVAADGRSGSAGLQGQVVVEQALVAVPVQTAPIAKPAAAPVPTPISAPEPAQPAEPAASETDSTSKQQEIKAIKSELRNLLDRLDKLEQGD